MNKTSSAVLAALMLSSASAVKMGYRPPSGSVPWGGAATRPTWDTPDYPVNYYIPNFGMDHNILTTMNSLKIAEKTQGKQLKASFAQNDAPTDLRTPNLGADEDVKFSLAAINESQKETGQQLKGVSFAQEGVEYAKSRGVDQEITDMQDSISLAEKKLNHQLPTQSFAQNDVSYNQKWQQLGQDSDISMAQANIAETEKMYGKFVPVQDEDGLWKVGKPDQTFVQLSSDPICSSSGCSQYKHPESKEAKYDMDYAVPHFGMDRDVMGSLENLKVAEGVVGHHWAGIDKDKYSNPAKKVDYNFAPRLDGDIIDSQGNLAATEKRLDHSYSLA